MGDVQTHEEELDSKYVYIYRDGKLITAVPIDSHGQLAIPYTAQAGDVAFVPVVVGLPMQIERVGQLA